MTRAKYRKYEKKVLAKTNNTNASKIRNYLCAMRLAVDELEEEGCSEEKKKELLKIINQAISKITKLLR